jgi:hypothetical protein
VAHLLPPLGAKAFYPLLGVIVKPGPMGSVFYYLILQDQIVTFGEKHKAA